MIVSWPGKKREYAVAMTSFGQAIPENNTARSVFSSAIACEAMALIDTERLQKS